MAQHIMNLTPLPMRMIRKGEKTIELRLNDEKRQAISVGDTIKFVNTKNSEDTLYVKVEELYVFESFDELYKSLPLLECGYTEDDIASASPNDMEIYYPKDKQALYGVVGIKMTLVTDNVDAVEDNQSVADEFKRIDTPNEDRRINIASALKNAVIAVMESVDISQTISTAIQEFTNNIRLTLSNAFNSDYFKELKDNITNSFIVECESSGSLGWCFLGIDGLGDELPLLYFTNMRRKLDEGKLAILQIDSHVAKQFSKETINDVVNKTEKLLSSNDAYKLQKAMIDFRARRYYDSASILSGLIDAQSIKELIYFGEKEENINQGWQAFLKAYIIKVSDKMDTKSISPKRKDRGNVINSFVEDNKEKIRIDVDFITHDLLLCYSLMSFFYSSNWHDYPQNKPMVINRHWLAHGMYDYDDVKKADCLKLLFILNQIADLYNR